MKIVVTGGSGKVGKYIVEDLQSDHEVTVLDLNNPPIPHSSFHRADVLSLSSLTPHLEGHEAVVHLAGIPHPLDHPGEKVFQVNTIGTFNVLEASASAGVRTFVFMSSESTLGFAFAKNRMDPVSLPITEDHPLRPQDPYALSKVSGELLCAGYNRTYGFRTLALRAPWIWVPEDEDRKIYRSLVADYHKWSQNLWAYVHVKDLCQAVRQSLDPDRSTQHETLFITADDQWTDRPTADLLSEFYPSVPVSPDVFTDRESLISNARAREILGYAPRCTREDILA